MAAREYQGAGGLRLHLDEPLSDEMRKQVSRGHLVPVDDAPEAESEKKAPAKAETVVDDAPKRPAANAKAETWQAYAVALGMDPEQAKDATKADCQDYAQVVEETRVAEQLGDNAETAE
ncbi:hypothetical protein [Streptomyces sp. NBC_00338]|uniref:hypothetical protein n=1 Tax=Streptomyces sp. NBC_00338 TaxID=2975715 RepID=UPI002256B935|nr:hypothetical protein [Streptomyces sp. NBC_00338]MCX5145089.1 hypothetical protein [Streptomyces sp. NBC_00338]